MRPSLSAFPYPEFRDTNGQIQANSGSIGMTLRDYLAAKALSCMQFDAHYKVGPCNHAIAERAYHIADFMLLERDKTGGAIVEAKAKWNARVSIQESK